MSPPPRRPFTFDTVYADVLAEPADPTARRVMSDYLSERAQPLGELIRTQLDLAEQGSLAPRALRVREQQLLSENAGAWRNTLAPWADHLEFALGLPVIAWARASVLARHADACRPLPGLHLILELDLVEAAPVLASLPLLEHVVALDLISVSRRDVPESGLFSPWFPLVRACTRLEALRLDGFSTDAEVDALCELLALKRPAALALHDLQLQPGPLRRLLDAASRLDGLTWLDLRLSNLEGSSQSLDDLIERGFLRTLDVSLCEADIVSFQALLRIESSRCVVHTSGIRISRLEQHLLLRDERRDAPSPSHGGNPFGSRPAAVTGQAPKSSSGRGSVGGWATDQLLDKDVARSLYSAHRGGHRAVLAHFCEAPVRVLPSTAQRVKLRELVHETMRDLVGLDHPNLVRWLDGGVDSEGLFLVREVVTGSPLSRLVPARGLATGSADRAAFATDLTAAHAAWAAFVVAGLCRALAALHAEGHLQRVLGLDSVWVDDQGQPRLATLGKSFTRLSRRKALAMPPEKAGGAPSTVQSDLFQLGVLWHVALTGFVPLAAADSGTGRLLLPEGLPAPDAEALGALLSPDAASRPASATAVLGAIERCASRHAPPLPPFAAPDWPSLIQEQLKSWLRWKLPS